MNDPQECIGGCGFHGSEATDGYCSVCYKRKREAVKSPAAAQGANQGGISAAQTNAAAIGAASSVAIAGGNGRSISSNHHSGTSTGGAVTAEDLIKKAMTGTTSAAAAPMTSTAGKSAETIGESMNSSTMEPALQRAETTMPPPPPPPPSSATAGGCTANILVEQPDKSRCYKCNKRVGLLGLKCRCGAVCCGVHLHAEEHDCQFDYRQMFQTQLETKNPKITTDKLPTRIQ